MKEVSLPALVVLDPSPRLSWILSCLTTTRRLVGCSECGAVEAQHCGICRLFVHTFLAAFTRPARMIQPILVREASRSLQG